ncbi:hypothetical protein Syun_010222 [Stephania yunnanensis]|uniref:Pectinesterase catalytic domain-containing protein n=1 Tax=Stephania yunnanensis TaxID=152371 RepID=A0AAP0PPF5_9MAGN
MVMKSYLGDLIYPQGWHKWRNYTSLDTLNYIEYMNVGPGSDSRDHITWGRSNTHDQVVFSFHRDHSPCDGFEEVLNCYKHIAQLLRLSARESGGNMIDMVGTQVRLAKWPLRKISCYGIISLANSYFYCWNTWLVTFGAHSAFRRDERMSLGSYLHDRFNMNMVTSIMPMVQLLSPTSMASLHGYIFRYRGSMGYVPKNRCPDPRMCNLAFLWDVSTPNELLEGLQAME